MPGNWAHVISRLLLAFVLGETVFATLLDIPSAFGPIYPVNTNPGSIADYLKAKPADFTHPGIWHTHDDLERIRNNVLNKTDPWHSAYLSFSVDSYSLSNYTIQGPKAVISRGHISNYTSFTNDARAAWQNSLMWYITRDQEHWVRATSILDSWGSNLTNIIGTDRSLLIGLEGVLFVNAAEIMRWEGGWQEIGSSWRGGSGFSIQLYWLFSRQSVAIGQANYGMVSIQALLAFAVYLDDVSLYNYAINEYINNPCAGVPGQYHPSTGQSGEAGRDQSHTQSGIGWAAYGARVAQSQGSDLYSLNDNLLFKAAEYAASYNLNQTVQYDAKWYRCEAVLVGGPWPNISTDGFGISNTTAKVWDHLYYQYVVRDGLDGPWTTQAKEAEGFEGHVTGADHPSWGDLIWA